MKVLGYLGIDQLGNHYTIKKHPRKELMWQLGSTHASKMYRDNKDKSITEVGYVIAGRWIDIYRVCNWKD